MVHYGKWLFITMKKIKKGCRWYRKFTTGEHITVRLITEPGNNFLTHITYMSSTGKKALFLQYRLLLLIRTIFI